MIDVALPHTRPTYSPHVAEFVTRVLERLKPLTSEPEIHNHVHEENTQETDERTQAVKLLKTGQNADAGLLVVWRMNAAEATDDLGNTRLLHIFLDEREVENVFYLRKSIEMQIERKLMVCSSKRIHERSSKQVLAAAFYH